MDYESTLDGDLKDLIELRSNSALEMKF